MSHERTLSRTSIVSDSITSSGRLSSETNYGSSIPSGGNVSPSNSSAGNNIKVIARFRPENDLEHADKNAKNILEVLSDSTCKIETKDFSGTFTFDRVFDMDSRQEEVFEYSLRPTVEDIINGYNGTVLAYGQTGSGKSYTMMGPSIDDPESRGAIPRIVDQIFDMIHKSPADIEYMVRVSYMEIYMEKIKDLLNPVNDNLPIHEDKTRGVYVKGLTEEYVSSASEVYQVMRQGSRIRSVASTNMNQESSRSHSIFVIVIAQKNTITGSQKTGQMFLVDLAGSEKVGKTGASGQTLEEAKKINKSLSALGMVINSLTDGKSSHVPYRDSKLTRILQESLGGNSRTSLIVNCSPSSYNDAETLSTLRFGVRAKTIKNKAKINAELSPAELRQLLRQSQSKLDSRILYEQKLESEIVLWRSGVPPAKSEWLDLSPFIATGGGGGASSVPSSPRSASALSTRSNITMTPLRKATATTARSHMSTPNINVNTQDLPPPSASSYVIPLSPCRSEIDDDYLQRENALQDQLAEKEELIERQEAIIAQFRLNRENNEKANNDDLDGNDPRQLRLEIDNLKYEKKELEIKVNALQDDNTELNSRLEITKEELMDLNLKASSSPSPRSPVMPSDKIDSSSRIYENEKRRKVSELLGAMYMAGDRNYIDQQLDEALVLADNLDNEQASRLKFILQDLVKSASLPVSTSSESEQSLEVNGSSSRPISAISSSLSTSTSTSISTSTSSISASMPTLSSASVSASASSPTDTITSYINDLLKQENDRFITLIGDSYNPAVEKLYESRLKVQSKTIEQLMSKVDNLIKEKAVLQSAIDDVLESQQQLLRQRQPSIDKTNALQAHISQFEVMKASLMRDLQDRCERIVELEISLDQARDQYDLALRNSNNKQQQKKMALLQRNLEQLTQVQRQLMEQNTQLKKEVVIDEKLLVARNERIQALEESLRKSEQIASEEREAFAKNLSVLRGHLTDIKPQDRTTMNSMKSTIVPNSIATSSHPFNIVKPLRGGGASGGGSNTGNSSKDGLWTRFNNYVNS